MIACIGAGYLQEFERGPRGVRCRNYVDIFGQTCPSHMDFSAEKSRPLLEPDTVLLKINVNPNWERKFTEAGVFVTTKTKQRELQVRGKHIEEAGEFGRKGFPYRTDVPDSGTAVFGKTGAPNVEVTNLLNDLAKAGYRLINLHIERREMKHLSVLIASFKKNGEAEFPITDSAISTLIEFLAGSWEFVHVYANPYRPDGTILHTVNCSHRRPDLKSQNALIFANGLWNLNPA